MKVNGPGSPFELFFENPKFVPEESRGLPNEFKAVYQGDWLIPSNQRYVFSNFVISRDGKTSFSIPGHEGGGDISGFNRHDQWIMALCRSRADGVIVGANTLRSETHHKWTSDFIFPEDKEAFAELRKIEGRSEFPFQIFVTNSGEIDSTADVFKDEKLRSIVIVPTKAADQVRKLELHNCSILEIGSEQVALGLIAENLQKDFGIKDILCEGGPRLYGSMVAEKLIDEEFLTSSPVLVGGSRESLRPGLIDGVALEPNNQLAGSLGSVRRCGDMLFLRSTFTR